jgi:hypothetical protein
MSFLSLLPELATTIGVAAAAKGVIDSVLGLRAKRRAHDLLSKQAASDPALRQLASQAAGRPLDETELREAARVIESSLGSLSDSDRRRIEEGLHQPNRSGEQRYIEELIKSG